MLNILVKSLFMCVDTFFNILPVVSQTLRIVAPLPIVLGSLDFGMLDAGTGSLDEDGTPPVGRGSPEAMPTVAKRDGGRMLFDAAMGLDGVGIFIDGALLSDDAVGFNILDLTVPPTGGFSICAGWEGVHASRGEYGGSVAFVRKPRTLVILLLSAGRTPSCAAGFALTRAGIAPGGGRRTPVKTGMCIGTEGAACATCSSVLTLLPVEDESTLDTEVVLSCALGRFTIRSACTGAAGTGAMNACEGPGGVTTAATE